MSPFANAAFRSWRNVAVSALVALAIMPVADARAERIVTLTPRLLKNAPLGSSITVGPASFVGQLAYDNYVTTGPNFANGGATNVAGNFITRLLADDITPNAALAGADVREMRFSVVNLNASAVNARANVRFWFDNAGVPGSYYNVPADVHFELDLNLPVGVNLLSVAIPASTFTLPASTFWVGWSYDNKDGAFATTLAQLDNLGQAFVGVASVGSSTNAAFMTTNAGSFFPDANPVGSLQAVGIPFNLALQLTVDEATPSQKSTWGRVKQLYR